MNNKKVANIVFNPFVNDSRVLKETISLANNGYEVEVIAHSDESLKEYEDKGNYKIRRFSFLNRKIIKGNLGKMKAYFQYAKKTIKHGKTFDYLHCNDLNTLPIGVVIKLFYNKNAKIIYDAHEYETETNGLHGLKKKIVEILEKKLIKYADAVIVVSGSIANEYAKLYNIPKPYLVLNTPFYQQIEKQNVFREKFGISQDKTIFLYQGSLGYGRGVETVIKTFRNIKDKNNIVIFMGYGALEEEIKKNAVENENIFFHPAVSPKILLDYTSSADFGISLIEDTCLNYRYCLPNKIFEYNMAEIPIIVSNLPEMKNVVEKNGIGLSVKENTAKGLEEAIIQIVNKNKTDFEKNIEKAKNIFNWEQQENILLSIYHKLS